MGNKLLDQYRNRVIKHKLYPEETWYINNRDNCVILTSHDCTDIGRELISFTVDACLGYIDAGMWIVTDKKVDKKEKVMPTVYCVYKIVNAGNDELIGVFNHQDKELMEKYTSERGYYIKSATLFNNYLDYQENQIKVEALAKLTYEEKKVLGLV